MTLYRPAQRVQVFDPQLRRYIEDGVITATTRCVRVSLDDRMVPINVDPADHPHPPVATDDRVGERRGLR